MTGGPPPPWSPVTGHRSRSFRQQLPRDGENLHLRRAAAELDELRVAGKALDHVLLHVAVAGQNVDRLEGDEGAHLGAVELARADVGDRLGERAAGEMVGID